MSTRTCGASSTSLVFPYSATYAIASRFLVQEQYKERMQETVAVDTNIRSRSPALQRRSPSSSQLHP